jgi:hypothetical protein
MGCKCMTNIFSELQKQFLRRDRRFYLTKRQQFVIVTMVLAFGLMLTQIVPGDVRYSMTVGLSIFAYVASAIALRENLRGIEWFTLLILPTLFTSAVALFYFLLPARWLTRIPFVVLYAIGIYALLLTENIYNVAADRTIALVRAAHSVGYLLTLITYFLLVQTVFAFRFPFFINAALIGGISFLLVFQSLWSVVLEERASRRLWSIAFALTLVLIELSWLFSFIPTQSTLTVLFLTTTFYGTVGMAQQYLVEKLYKKTVIEFFTLCSIVFIIVMLATSWRGNI